MMSANDKQLPLLTPPQKKQHHNRARCHNCTCQQFQSDNAVTSAVDSDEKTYALVKWLSVGISSNSDDNNKGEKKMGFNEQNERLNGWAAMIGIIAAMGSYATTGQIIPGIW
mgnify:CR=1 FL=1